MSPTHNVLTIGINGIPVHLPVTDLVAAGEVELETILEHSQLVAIPDGKPQLEYQTPVTRGRRKYDLRGKIGPGETAPIRQGSQFHVSYV